MVKRSNHLIQLLKTQFFKLTFLVLIFQFACTNENNIETPPNQAPEIEVILTESSNILSHTSIELSCIAFDSDGDEIYFKWSAVNGAFDNITASLVKWQAPNVNTKTRIKITVQVKDDFNNSDTQSVFIKVNPIEPELIRADIYPSDDTYVSSGTPNDNFGHELSLNSGYVDFGGAGISYYKTYLKFNLSALPQNIDIKKAELHCITGNNSSNVKPVADVKLYFVNDSDWNENQLTYTIRPTPENKIITKIDNVTFDIVSKQIFDLTWHLEDKFQESTYYSVMLESDFISTGSDFCHFYSKELSKSYSPKLYVEYTYK